MDLKEKDAEVRRQYGAAKANQFGTMHERMKFLLEAAQKCRLWEFDNATWNAIHDLETEVQYHRPTSPPFGRRIGYHDGKPLIDAETGNPGTAGAGVSDTRY